MLTCIPLTDDELRALPGAALTDVAGHAVTPSLAEALGYGPEDDEDAEFAALTYASVAGLRRSPRRLVAVADVPAAEDLDDSFGSVRVPSLAWSQVTSLFVDEPAVADLVARAHAAATRAADLDEAWDSEPVQALLAAADLLWYGPEEHAELVSQGGE